MFCAGFFRVNSSAARTARTPPVSGRDDGAEHGRVVARREAEVVAEDEGRRTAKAMFTILPRSSMSFTMPNMGMEFAKARHEPGGGRAVHAEQAPEGRERASQELCQQEDERERARQHEADARDGLHAALQRGHAGMTVTPVSSVKTAAASPTVMTARTPRPNHRKPRIIARSQRHSPSAMSTANSTMGTRFRTSMPSGKPAASPPAERTRRNGQQARQHAARQRGPVLRLQDAEGDGDAEDDGRAEHGADDGGRRAARPARARQLHGKGAPPMSFARIEPANMAGSAPRKP